MPLQQFQAAQMSAVPAGVVLRHGSPSDLDVCAEFNTAMAKETENIDLPPQTIRTGVAKVLEGSVAAAYFLVELEGEVVGQLMITKEWSDW